MSVRLIAGRNVNALAFIKELLLEDPDMSPDEFYEGLTEMLVTVPERVFINIMIDEDTQDSVGFLIAVAPVNRAFGFIYQAWSDPKRTTVGLRDKLFFRVCMWASTLGLRELRMETNRNPNGFERRWNFEHHSTVMTFPLGEQWELELQEKMISREESENGLGSDGTGSSGGRSERVHIPKEQSGNDAEPAAEQSTKEGG